MNTAKEIHSNIGYPLTRQHSEVMYKEGFRAFTVADIEKIINDAKGGVCEWEVDRTNDETHNTQCGQSYVFDWEFKITKSHRYCPGCGKEIKIV